MISTEAIKVLKERKTLCQPRTNSPNPNKRFSRSSVPSLDPKPQLLKSRLLPELFAHIVELSDVDMYFTYTQVNITFRRLVYKNLPPSNAIPRDLTIHLLNNQKRVWLTRLALRNRFLPPSPTTSFHSQQNSPPVSPTSPKVDIGSAYIADQLISESTVVFAPDFDLKNIRPELTYDSKYRNMLLRDWSGAYLDIEHSGTFEIYLLRKEMKFARRHPLHFWKHYEGPWEQNTFFDDKHLNGDFEQDTRCW